MLMIVVRMLLERFLQNRKSSEALKHIHIAKEKALVDLQSSRPLNNGSDRDGTHEENLMLQCRVSQTCWFIEA